jgi:preprotein translocase subunit secB
LKYGGKMDKITLVSYFVSEVSMKHLTDDEKNKNGKINLNIGSNEEVGKVKLGIEISDEYKEIKISIVGDFELLDGLGEQQRKELLVTAGAEMLYEYAKSYIASMTIFDKIPVMVNLPDVDFEKLYKDNDKNK